MSGMVDDTNTIYTERVHDVKPRKNLAIYKALKMSYFFVLQHDLLLSFQCTTLYIDISSRHWCFNVHLCKASTYHDETHYTYQGKKCK